MSATNLETTLASLRHQSEVLAELQRRCAALREAGERSPAQLGALTADIDAGIDAYLCIAEQAAVTDPAGEWHGAVTELERQLRRLGVLRGQVLSLYVAAPESCGSAPDASLALHIR